MIKLKRAYDEPSPADGLRILVERLWPRGVTKEQAKINMWLKEIAPSTELRKWYNHDVTRWPEFRTRYRAALKDQGNALTLIKDLCNNNSVTFVYAAKDEEHNSAVVLKEFLERDY